MAKTVSELIRSA